MLDDFREIYDCELQRSENQFEELILSSAAVRMFVYEVCKKCLVPRLDVTRKPTSKEIWEWAAKIYASQPGEVKTESVKAPEIDFCSACGTVLGVK